MTQNEISEMPTSTRCSRWCSKILWSTITNAADNQKGSIPYISKLKCPTRAPKSTSLFCWTEYKHIEPKCKLHIMGLWNIFLYLKKKKSQTDWVVYMDSWSRGHCFTLLPKTFSSSELLPQIAILLEVGKTRTTHFCFVVFLFFSKLYRIFWVCLGFFLKLMLI